MSRYVTVTPSQQGGTNDPTLEVQQVRRMASGSGRYQVWNAEKPQAHAKA